jgi:hypothetical protein
MTPPFSNYFFNPHREPSKKQWIFEGLLQLFDIVAWLAREKAMKSTLMLQMMICAAVGRAFLHFRFAASGPLKVFIVDYELKRDTFYKRYHAIVKALGLSETEKQLLEQNLTVFFVREWRSDGNEFPYMPPTPLTTDKNKYSKQYQALQWWKNFIEQHPADIYCFDPLRYVHNENENSSDLAAVFASFQLLCKGKTVISPHHLYKLKEDNKGDVEALNWDMRAWSDRARGSGVIKGHTDVVICQARGVETVDGAPYLYWGAFGRDMDDILPMRLDETERESFTWQTSFEVPEYLTESWKVISEHKGPLPATRSGVAGLLEGAGVKRTTAFRHVQALLQAGLLIESDVAGEPFKILQRGLVPTTL